jgi:hypothetical protein
MMRFAASLVLVLVLAGCGSAGRPARPIGHEAAEPAASACLPRRFRDASLGGGFTVRDGRARLCFELGGETTDHACLLLDREGRIAGESAWEEPKPYEPEEREHDLAVVGGGYTVCARRTKRCTSFRMSHPPAQALPGQGVVSDDGALAFVLHDRPAQHSQFPNEIVGELYETRGGRLLGTVKLTTILGVHGFGDTSMTRAVEILGPRSVLVGAYPAGPGGMTALVDPGTGKGIPLHGFFGEHLLLDARTMLVLDERDPGTFGPTHNPVDLSIIDRTTLTVVQKLAVPGNTSEDPERAAMSMTRLGGVVLIASVRPATLVLFDVAARRLSPPRSLPLCPG